MAGAASSAMGTSRVIDLWTRLSLAALLADGFSPYRRNKGLRWPQCTLLKLAVHWPVHLGVAKRSERNRVSGAVSSAFRPKVRAWTLPRGSVRVARHPLGACGEAPDQMNDMGTTSQRLSDYKTVSGRLAPFFPLSEGLTRLRESAAAVSTCRRTPAAWANTAQCHAERFRRSW